MCIRDSTYTGVLGNYVSFNKNDIANIYELVNRFVSFYGNAAYTYDGKYMVTGSIRWARTNSVSYTHLDVYKRQVLWCCFRSVNGFCRNGGKTGKTMFIRANP